ncbi:Ger(x)C family spore germination protein [Cellulosilyticum ruminicola]|uniref:Ger(x)C family spore germination protein n=1 Tax=Cellulosilyticum ruminicola TaxID=425254 RepID=UPI0006D1D140|nr:Ger(x)C family spore germination protein [Cellulosilyticum ruminicola]
MQNKLKFIAMTMLILNTSFILTGCWDSVEINERNVVMEVAIDKNQDADLSQPINKRDSYQITYTIPDRAKLSGKDSLAKDVKSSIVTTTPTIETSVDEVESKSQNTITFSHTQAIVLGEELMKDSDLFRGAIDGLIRNMEISRTTNLLATRGKAGNLTQEDNEQNPILGLYVMKYFNNTERPVSYAKEQLVGNMIRELEDTNISTIPVINTDEKGAVEISGAAVIRNYELVDFIGKDVVRGQLFVEGKINQVPIVVEYKGSSLTYIIDTEHSKITFNSDGNVADANIEILTEGNITEYVSTDTKNIFSIEDINQITILLQDEIRHQVMVAVNKSKEINVDFLNIGLQMYRKHPKQWQSYSQNWEDEGYKSFPIKIQVTSTIKNTGMLE